MSWNADTANARIRQFLRTAPTVEQNVVLDSQLASIKKARGTGLLDAPPVRRAFIVSGVHLYGHLLDFDDLVSENGNETETSHNRLLQFLTMHYLVWDGIIDQDNCDRVDYHGARLHAVMTKPDGDFTAQVERAIALAAKLSEAAEQVGRAHGFPSRIRFGIDHGTCLAMTTGRSHERDTLFVGRPANYAAKLAAADNVAGIFLTEKAQALLGASRHVEYAGRHLALDEAFVQKATRKYSFDRLRAIVEKLSNLRVNPPTFSFHRATPPLTHVKFADLVPSKSIRMGMASLFADIDGYTAFVDSAIAGGSFEIKKAVETLHVIREELNAVLNQDFGGKRVRFIGDCIHGCLAKGDRLDDMAGAIRDAVLCATAMRSSFDLCLDVVKPGARIDLAIGIEYGPTPLTRIGDVGVDSVRCGASRASIEAERMQQTIEGGGIRLGPTAASLADKAVSKNFTTGPLMTFDAAADLLAAPISPVVQVIRNQPTARSHLA